MQGLGGVHICQSDRRIVQSELCDRSFPGHIETEWSAKDHVSSAPSQLRIDAREGRRADETGAGVAGTQ